MENPAVATPQISVVVAAVDASRSIVPCLASIRESCRSVSAEIIVVEAGSDPAVAGAASETNCIHEILPDGTLTPVLWGKGIALAKSESVALLTAHCTVTREWATGFLTELSSGSDAAGGPIALGKSASILDSAIYFVRYSAFMRRPDTSQIAGDNSAYRKSSLPALWNPADGFWELAINREILKRSGRISWRGDAVIQFQKSFRFSTIIRQRFEHGRAFGRERVVELQESRLRIMLAAPLVPFVLLVRAGLRVIRARRYGARFLLSMPFFLVIASCWAAGEAIGAGSAR